MCQDAPDFGPLKEASVESARIMKELGEEQMEYNREQQAKLDPYMYGSDATYDDAGNVLTEGSTGFLGLQMEGMNLQNEFAADSLNFIKDNDIRGLQKSIVDDAREFNTQGYQEQLANQAAADAGRAFGQTRSASERASRSMGINPNSGAGMAMNSQNNLGLAAMRGSAVNNTRNQARDMGYARRMEASNMAMGLGGSAISAYQGAGNSGSVGFGAANNATNTFNAGFGSGAGIVGQGQQMGLNGLGSALNSQAQFAGQTNAGIGQMVGTGAGMWLGMQDFSTP